LMELAVIGANGIASCHFPARLTIHQIEHEKCHWRRSHELERSGINDGFLRASFPSAEVPKRDARGHPPQA
jgi:hypothetical protein